MLGGMLLYLGIGAIDVYLSQHVQQAASWASLVFSYAVVPSLLLVYIRRRHYVTPAVLGLRPDTDQATTSELVCFTAGLTVAWFVVSHLFHTVGLTIIQSYPELGYVYLKIKLLPVDGPARVLGAIYLSLSAGCFEEIMFRGLTKLIIGRIRIRNQDVWYVLVSSLLFGLFHWGRGLDSMITNVGVGLMASSAFLKLKDLRPLIGAHVIYDFGVLVLYTGV